MQPLRPIHTIAWERSCLLLAREETLFKAIMSSTSHQVASDGANIPLECVLADVMVFIIIIIVERSP